MKAAVIYYSMSENTKFAADKIAEKTHADVIRIEPVKEYPTKGAGKFFWGGKSAIMKEEPELLPYEFQAEQYDTIIIGTPVWARNFAPPIRTFLHEHKEELAGKRVAVFICFSGGGADKAINQMKEYMEVNEFASELILIDPKEKQTAENEEKIEAFCSALL